MKESLYIDIQLFPSINYCHTLLKYSNIIFEQYDNHQKSGFGNRYVIASASGRLKLSVPLLGGRDQRTQTKDLRIDYSSRWPQQHWGSLSGCYGRSPFFEFYAPALEELLKKKHSFLLDLQLEALQLLFRWWKRSPQISFTEAFRQTLPSPVEDALYQDFSVSETPIIYPQVFQERVGFEKNLSVLDLLFNVGPDCFYYLSINV